jgi:hypothetical protein
VNLLAPHCRDCLVEMLNHNFFVSFLFVAIISAYSTRPSPI